MISGTAGDNAPALFLICELTDLISCSPELEAPGILQILCLEIYIAAV